MKERPILFSGAMVRALLDGSKTQTRRVIKPQPVRIADSTILQWRGGLLQPERLPKNSNMLAHCPHGQPGDCLWVRETWAAFDGDWRFPGKPHDLRDGPWPNIAYSADSTLPEGTARPSIHMPRWASRINLEITGVHVERLHDISEADARAEGIDACDGLGTTEAILDLAKRMGTFKQAVLRYATLWESINGAGSWDANPFVWVIEFRRVS